jgi:hypothetical protein
MYFYQKTQGMQGDNEEGYIIPPPNYYTTGLLFDINFHPNKNFLAAGSITGEVKM